MGTADKESVRSRPPGLPALLGRAQNHQPDRRRGGDREDPAPPETLGPAGAPAAPCCRQIHTIRSRHSRVGGRQPVVRCGRVKRTASASSPAQRGRRCLGGSVPESSASPGQGSEDRRRSSLPCPVLPSVRSFARLGSCFPPEIGDISRSLPSHSGHPHSAPQKQLPIIYKWQRPSAAIWKMELASKALLLDP